MTTSKKYKDNFKILSDIKPHYNYLRTLFSGLRDPSDIDFAIHRLLTLQTSGILDKKDNIVIERGITDFLQCFLGRPENKDIKNTTFIKNSVEEENYLLRDSGHKIEKILLIMKDPEFIEHTILKEKTRKDIYQNLKIYLEKQEHYVEFTKTYNKINEIIEISDSMDYINNLKYFNDNGKSY